MRYGKAFSIVKNNLARHKLRTGLSASAFAIAVILTLVLASVIGGMENYYNSQLEGMGSNWIEIVPGVSQQVSNGFGGSTGAAVYPLTIGDANAVKNNATDFTYVTPVIGSGVYFPSVSNSTFMEGVWPDIKQVFDLSFASGGFWSSTFNYTNGAEIPTVLGYTVWHDEFNNTLSLNEDFTVAISNVGTNGSSTLSNYTATVAGFLAQKGTFAGINFDNVIYFPIDAAMNIAGHGDRVSIILGSASSSNVINNAATQATDIIKADHNGQVDFTVETQTEMISQIDAIVQQNAVLVDFIEIFTFFIAGISVFIVMLISVSERTKEVGILKSVGAKSGDVMKIFSFDALAISAIGAIIGSVIGYFIALLLQRIGGGFFVYIDLASFPVIAGETIVLVMMLGVLFGIYPAYRASKLQPVEALRYE